MKRYIFIIFIMSLSPKAMFALQSVNNDTIINTIVQWKEGDKHFYKYSQQEATVVDEDTLYGNYHHYENFSLEVTLSDSIGYVVKYTLLNHKEISRDRNGKEIELYTFPIPKGTEILFRTDKGGRLVDILEWEELSQKLSDNSPLSYITDGTFININKPDAIPLNPISMIPDKETLAETLFYVTQLFMYNGQEFIEGSYYSGDDKFQSEWDNELIDMKVELFVNRDENGNVVIYQNNIIDSDQLIDNYINYFSRFMENPDSFKTPERPYIFMEVELLTVIDRLSGLVISANYDRLNTQGNTTVITSAVVKRITD